MAVFGYILLIAIVLLFSYLFGKNKKAINIILLILCALVPISAYCLCDYEINVEANVEIEEYNGRTFYHVSGDDSLLDNISIKELISQLLRVILMERVSMFVVVQKMINILFIIIVGMSLITMFYLVAFVGKY